MGFNQPLDTAKKTVDEVCHMFGVGRSVKYTIRSMLKVKDEDDLARDLEKLRNLLNEEYEK
ncbi:MAG: hypothetical protein ACOCQD_00295 [archaeon]